MKVTDIIKNVDYCSVARKYRRNSIVLMLIALFIPFFAHTGSLKPLSENFNVWFQRSGSLIVLFSSLAEYHAFKMLATYSPDELANTPEITTKIKYSKQAKILIVISAIFICVGTLIWGYGDIIY